MGLFDAPHQHVQIGLARCLSAVVALCRFRCANTGTDGVVQDQSINPCLLDTAITAPGQRQTAGATTRQFDMNERIYRRPDVETLVGLSRSTLYAMIADGTFPKPVKLGKRAVGWRARDIEAWVASRRTEGV